MHVAIGKYDKGGPCKQYRVRMELLDIYNREREREREREYVVLPGMQLEKMIERKKR